MSYWTNQTRVSSHRSLEQYSRCPHSSKRLTLLQHFSCVVHMSPLLESFSCVMVVLYCYDFYRSTCFLPYYYYYYYYYYFIGNNKFLHLNCKLVCIKCIYFHSQHAHKSAEAHWKSYSLDSVLNQNRSYGLVGKRKRIIRGRIALKVIWLLGKNWDRNVAVLCKISSVILEVRVTEMKFLSIFCGFYSSRLTLQIFHISVSVIFSIFTILP